jgi:hypothetical protein
MNENEKFFNDLSTGDKILLVIAYGVTIVLVAAMFLGLFLM